VRSGFDELQSINWQLLKPFRELKGQQTSEEISAANTRVKVALPARKRPLVVSNFGTVKS
jgi:hypothetical protein